MSELRFQILGPMVVTREGRPLDLGGPKQRALLLALLLGPGRVLPLGRLQSLLWEDPPVSATANTRTYASGLRRVLGPVVVARDGGYLLDVDATAADLGRFTVEVAAARAARSGGEVALAERHYEQAIGLWRGPCGEDLPPDVPLRHQLVSVTERRVIALEEFVDLRLRRGPDGALPAELREALTDHPTREGLWARLMQALAALGDTAGALEAYQAARAELATRLGIDPGPDLEALHHALLTRATTGPGRAAERGDAAAARPGLVPHELPPRPHVLIGRDACFGPLETAVRQRGDDRPVVLAVDGPGGIGKSALAVELAHRLADQHADGEVYLDLQGGWAGLRPPTAAELLARLVRSCGGTDPAEDDVDALAAHWRSLSHGLRLLVVLDNVSDEEQVRPLVPNGPGCTVILTSRRRLTTVDLTAGQTLSLLDDAESLAVLRARVGGADDRGLRRIAELCGGLPLALRMAAARLDSRTDLTVDDVAARLADGRRRLRELGCRDTGVRAMFESSFTALVDSADPVDRDAARLLCLLGVVPVSACAVAAAYALLDVGTDHGDACVGRLVELRLVTGDDGQLRLHDLLRLFARDVAATTLTPTAIAAARHRAAWFYAESARRAWRSVRYTNGPPLPPSPLTTARPTSSRSRSDGLRWLAAHAASLRELVFALSTLPEVPTAVAVEIVRCLVSYDGVAGSFRDTIAASRQLVECAAARDDPLAELIAYRLTAINLQRLGRGPEARAIVARTIDLLSIVDDDREKITTLNTYGIFQTEWGDHDAAERSLATGLALAREVGEPRWLSMMLHSLGMHYRVRGQTPRCVELLREALELRRALDDTIGETYTRMQLGKALPVVGGLAEGLTHLDIALGLAEQLGSAELSREVRMDRMEVLATAGRDGDATVEFHAALEVCRRLNDQALTAEVVSEARRMQVVGAGTVGRPAE